MSSEDRTSRAGVSAPRKRAPLPMRCDTSYRAVIDLGATRACCGKAATT